MENIRRHFGGSSSSRSADDHSVFHTDVPISSPNVSVTESKSAAAPDTNKLNKNCCESGKTLVSETKTHTNVLKKTKASSPKPIPKTRSVFHTDPTMTLLTTGQLVTAGQTPPWLLTSLQTYMDSVGTLCVAATRLADEFTGHLKDSGHGSMAMQFRDMLQHVEKAAAGEMAQLASDVQTCWQVGSHDHTADNDLIAKNLLRFIQAQYQFFHCATEHITEFTRCQATEDLNSSLNHVTATMLPKHSARSKVDAKSEGLCIDAKLVQPHYGEPVKSPGMSPSVDSPSSLRKQISSFFSKLSPKTVAPSNEGQSVFFVGLECQPQQQSQLQQQQQSLESEQQLQQQQQQVQQFEKQQPEQQQQPVQQQRKVSQPEIKPKSRTVLQQRSGIERETEEKQPVAGQIKDAGDVCIASQEELDTVINLLSCGGANVSQPVPAPRHANISKAVGSQRSHVVPGGAPAYHQHRRSDSLTTAETVMNKSKTNTWPTKLGQGFSLQDTMNHMYTYENLCAEGEYPQSGMAGWTQMPMEYDPAYMQGPSPWAVDDSSGQRNWPYVTAADGQDYRGRHWSAIYDSSSCSDESSSTGEVPWMMTHDYSSAMHGGQKGVVDERVAGRPAVSAIHPGMPLNGGAEKGWSAKQVWTPVVPPAGSWAPEVTTAPPGGQPVHHPSMTVPWNEPGRVQSLWQPGVSCPLPQQNAPK